MNPAGSQWKKSSTSQLDLSTKGGKNRQRSIAIVFRPFSVSFNAPRANINAPCATGISTDLIHPIRRSHPPRPNSLFARAAGLNSRHFKRPLKKGLWKLRFSGTTRNGSNYGGLGLTTSAPLTTLEILLISIKSRNKSKDNLRESAPERRKPERGFLCGR